MTLVAVLFAAVALASCGEESKTETNGFGHRLSDEQTEKLLAEAYEDLQIIAGVTPETIDDLSRALTGSALEQTRAGIEEDLAQGRYRKRDYQNIKVRAEEYIEPVVSMFAEFDDAGYYVDANTGAQLSQPTNEHKSFAFSMIEEDGRWKIRGIFQTSTETTPRELPGTQTVPTEGGAPGG